MYKKRLEDIKNGQILLFDKPLHWTSFQVVNKVRWMIRKTFEIKKIKVGHAGTLDPLASGLVILCTGKATKTIEGLMGQTKVYTGVFSLGATRPSYDMETDIDQHYPTEHITKTMITETAEQFVGTIQQQPPVFSALKKDGKRLYEYARKGEKIDIPTREVNISSFEITTIDGLEVHFKVKCSKGTYIRSLAHDFGKALQSGAYLSQLRRVQIGDYNVEDALHIEDFQDTLLSED